MTRVFLPVVFVLSFALWIVAKPAAADTTGVEVKMMLSSIKLPEGFKIDLYADNLPGARSMALSPSGVLYVGTRKTGRVYAVVDQDQDMRADRVVTVAEGLDTPNGVAWREGDLYVAEVHRILRYGQMDSLLEAPPKPVVVYDGYPRDRHHGWKFIRFGPDGRLYVPVGAPCNVCRRDNQMFATITRLNSDGSGMEIFAHGVRNSVGFDWHPLTGELWFTDNGRDWLGDDQPPDELNRAPIKGLHFGFPFCHGGILGDPEYGSQAACDQFTSPAVALGAHVAALGMRFYTGHMFPEAYRNQIFIAEHGSWNSTRKSGYRVTLVRVRGAKIMSYEPFARGWRIGNRAWGRPVDVQVMSDGSLLVSDDINGVIYRIYWAGPKQ